MPSEYGIETDSVTLQRFVLNEQRKFPDATGDLTTLLTSLLTAVKVGIWIFSEHFLSYPFRPFPLLSEKQDWPSCTGWREMWMFRARMWRSWMCSAMRLILGRKWKERYLLWFSWWSTCWSRRIRFAIIEMLFRHSKACLGVRNGQWGGRECDCGGHEQAWLQRFCFVGNMRKAFFPLLGKYIVTFDLLDGSSYIDCLVSIGIIFGIFKKTADGQAQIQDILQPGEGIGSLVILAWF